MKVTYIFQVDVNFILRCKIALKMLIRPTPKSGLRKRIINFSWEKLFKLIKKKLFITNTNYIIYNKHKLYNL